MTETRIDELLDKADSKFALVIGAAKRTRQITDFLNARNPGEAVAEGSVPPPVSELMIKKPLIIAIDEIADGKVRVAYREPAVEETVEATTAEQAVEPEQTAETEEKEEAAVKETPKKKPAKTAAEEAEVKETPKKKPAKTAVKEVPKKKPAKTAVKEVPKKKPGKKTPDES